MLLHNVPRVLGMISPRLLPPGWHDLKEPYSVAAMIRAQSGGQGRSKLWAVLPPWMRKLFNGNRKFWAYTPEEIERHLEGRKMTEDADRAAAELRQRERDDMRKAMGLATVITTRDVTDLDYDAENGSPASFEMQDPNKQHREPQEGLFGSKTYETR